jgi:hypothetical protein
VPAPASGTAIDPTAPVSQNSIFFLFASAAAGTEIVVP